MSRKISIAAAPTRPAVRCTRGRQGAGQCHMPFYIYFCGVMVQYGSTKNSQCTRHTQPGLNAHLGVARGRCSVQPRTHPSIPTKYPENLQTVRQRIRNDEEPRYEAQIDFVFVQ